jgi:hypothetical protein
MTQTAFNQTRSHNQYYATQSTVAKFFTYDVQNARVPRRAGRPRVAPTTNHRLSNDSTFARTYDANGNTTRKASRKKSSGWAICRLALIKMVRP